MVFESPEMKFSDNGFKITKEFLEKTLNKRVKSFKITQGSNNGENFLGVLHAVNVTFEDSDQGEQETDLLIKVSPTHPGRLVFIKKCGVFDREYFIYNDLFPKLVSLTTEENGKFAISIPPFHGGNIAGKETKYSEGPWANENFIVMTDLRKMGYRLTDRQSGLDYDHGKLAVSQLAVIHAMSWIYKQENGIKHLNEKFPLLKDYAYADKEGVENVAPIFFQLMWNAYTSSKKIVKDAVGDHPAFQGLTRILSSESEISITFFKFLNKHGIDDNALEVLMRVRPEDSIETSDPWMVVNHGDCWSNNLLFKYDDAGKPTDVKFVDFQLTREACPTLDLAYLLHGSIRTKLRQQIEKALLEQYYQTFCKVCDSASTQTLPGFTFDTLLRRYRRAKIYGLLMAIPCLYFFMMPSDGGQNLDEKDEKEDFSQLMSSGFEKALKNEDLRNELVDLVLDLYENGIL